MDKKIILTGALAAAAGAGLMYLLDPDRGRRRRAIAHDRTAHLVREAEEKLEDVTKDLTNRARGTVAELKQRFECDQIDDVVLVERVRAKMGRVATDMHAIRVTADNGLVKLYGLVAEPEIAKLIKCAYSVRGVKQVESKLVSRLEPPQQLAKAATARAATL